MIVLCLVFALPCVSHVLLGASCRGCVARQDAVVVRRWTMSNGVSGVCAATLVGFGSAQAFVPVLCIVGGVLPVSHAGG